MWQIAQANEYIVVTGAGIEDLKLAKKCYVWPLQRSHRISIIPRNFTLNLNAMTIEKLEFSLPAVFTIGVKDDRQEVLKYARLLALADSNSKKDGDHLEQLVRGVIEGETRVLAAGMTMEEIFSARKFFKDNVVKHVQSELSQFGLTIYNANVKQMTDTPGSEYFAYLRMKSHEGAISQAKIDVANARYLGNVGEKQREGQTRQETARVEAGAVIFESERKAEIAQAAAKLDIAQTEYSQGVRIAKIAAEKAANMRDAELQREVEIKRAAVEEERLRAEFLSKAKVDAEAVAQAADARLYSEQRAADARLYAAQREAEGLRVRYEAQADGLARLGAAFGGNSSTLMQYLMLEKGLYQDLAKTNAAAIQGLQPKITVWNTGASGAEGGDSDPMAAIRNIFQALPPMLQTINDQTGVSPPPWLASLPASAPAVTARPQ